MDQVPRIQVGTRERLEGIEWMPVTTLEYEV